MVIEVLGMNRILIPQAEIIEPTNARKDIMVEIREEEELVVEVEIVNGIEIVETEAHSDEMPDAMMMIVEAAPEEETKEIGENDVRRVVKRLTEMNSLCKQGREVVHHHRKSESLLPI